MKIRGWSLIRILQLSLWTLLILGILIIWGFARSGQDSMLVREVSIRFTPNTEMVFTDWNDVALMLTGDGNVAAMQGKPVSLYDVGKLERTLEESPYIRNAEVYTELDGVLKIDVEQRRPILRVFRQDSKGFYVDEEGWKMPLSPRYSARVPVVRGAIAEGYEGNDSIRTEQLADVYGLVLKLKADDFWDRQIDEIHIDSKGEYVLIPKIGSQRILLGDSKDLEEKLYRLKMFYRHAMNRVGWTTYRVINLKYSGQVVCEK